MLRLEGKQCLVVGGGLVAERRVISLREAGAFVTLVAPDATEGLRSMGADGSIRLLLRPYREGDASKEYTLVIAATNDHQVNEVVKIDASAADVLFSGADDSTRSDFIVPAVFRRGKLTFAVSTGGESPAYAARLQRELKEAYGFEYEAYVDFLGEARRVLRDRVDDAKLRPELLRRIAEWELLVFIREDAEAWPALQASLLHRLEQEPNLQTIRAISDEILRRTAVLRSSEAKQLRERT